MKSLSKLLTLVGVVNYLLVLVCEAAPTAHDVVAHEAVEPVAQHHDISAPPSPVAVHKSLEASAVVSNAASNADADSFKPKRAAESRLSGAELETQETGYHLPPAYPSAHESDYGYDSGKNSYGKQASDWSLYDQGKCCCRPACQPAGR